MWAQNSVIFQNVQTKIKYVTTYIMHLCLYKSKVEIRGTCAGSPMNLY